MVPCSLKTVLNVMLLQAALGLGVGWRTGPAQAGHDAAANEHKADKQKPSGELSPAEFNQLRPILDLKNQPWATIPWKYSITEARKLAAARKKPIFMVINTGNALGCT
jgi:hypothetical protein